MAMANEEKGASESSTLTELDHAQANLDDSDLVSAKIQKWKDKGRIIKHTRHGVWDEYVEVDADAGKIPLTAAVAKKYETMVGSLPYLGRMVKGVLGIPGCKTQAILYVGASLGGAVIPAVTLW